MNAPTTAAVVEDQQHALLSPSSAYTWLECAASTAAQIGQPDDSSEYADDGTASHELAKWCLDTDTDTAAYAGRIIKVGAREFEVDEERIEYVQLYVDEVRDRKATYELAGATVTMLIEQRVSIEHITGEKGAKGTSDCVLIAQFADGTTEICVIDLKYGRGVQVLAENNPQGMLYAEGARFEHADFYDFTSIRIVIHQPRVDPTPSEWALTPDDLAHFIEDIAMPAAERAMELVKVGPVETDFAPGEKQCRFCKAKAVCPALAKHVENVIGADFETIVADHDSQTTGGPQTVELLDNEDLGVIYPALPLIESWGKAVLARIEHELLHARTVPGVKLVAGRRGARQWNDAEEAERLLKSMRLKQDQMYNFKVISPTQADKLLSKESPRRWKKVETLVVQRDGRPSVAPDSDPRPALEIQPPEDDFDVAEADDGCDLA